jgi:hypothetical protein
MASILTMNAQNLVPGQGGPEYETQSNQVWFGRWDHQVITGGILDKDTVDAGNTDATTLIRHGLALGIISASNQFTHWNPYATDGSHRLAGFYIGPGQAMSLIAGSTVERLIGDILVGGNLYAHRAIIPGETTIGIAGKAYEFLLREQLRGRFMVSDDFFTGGYENWKVRELTATVSLALKDHKTHFTNLGAAGSITVTLPAPVPGLEFMFTNLGAQNIVLEGPATGEYHINGLAADTDTMTAANEETVMVKAVRVAATPTYRYIFTAPNVLI